MDEIARIEFQKAAGPDVVYSSHEILLGANSLEFMYEIPKIGRFFVIGMPNLGADRLKEQAMVAGQQAHLFASQKLEKAAKKAK